MKRGLPSLHSFPYGASLEEDGVQFVVYSHSATAMRLLLYDQVEDSEPSHVISFDSRDGKCGDVWYLFVENSKPGLLYHFQADGPFDPDSGMRFDGRARLIDPYAKALAGEFLPSSDGILRPPKCVVIDEHFDWQGDRVLGNNFSDSVIYEMHVRGMTKSSSSGVKFPGTYLGVIEKIPYLQSLGITAVELMPIYEFPTKMWDGSKMERPNYWGYDPMAFFSPHRGYASGREPGSQVNEFKQMVKSLHAAGIEVILDVVFNHTAEGNEKGPTFSFKGLENSVYYLLENGGGYRNFSGCGNTVNGNHPVVREMIFHCLRYWVFHYHIDGFRFDLASILSRNRNGDLVPNPPLVELIAEDPLLADTKLIAEAWDAAGAYQVGSFSTKRWAEWNGQYRDDVRHYWSGYIKDLRHMATRIAGSSDLYQSSGREPFHGINFVTAHDGFTLSDLVSYESKHNDANGEENRDGENYNISINCGVEGPTDNPEIEALRFRLIRNYLATLLLSQGVPMLLSGDECRRTQYGNNNTYCQDNETSWFDWNLVEKNANLLRFCRMLIALRNQQPTFRRREFLSGEMSPTRQIPDVSWYNRDGETVDWNQDQESLICLLAGTPKTKDNPPGKDAMIVFHNGKEPITMSFPGLVDASCWKLIVDTSAISPFDFVVPEEADLFSLEKIEMQNRSLKCFLSID